MSPPSWFKGIGQLWELIYKRIAKTKSGYYGLFVVAMAVIAIADDYLSAEKKKKQKFEGFMSSDESEGDYEEEIIQILSKADMKKKKMQEKLGWTGTSAKNGPKVNSGDEEDDELDFREQKKRAFREDEARERR